MLQNRFIHQPILRLSLAFIGIYSGLISIPTALAGESIIQGTSVDSSFINSVPPQLNPLIPENSSITVNGETWGVSNELQEGLNKDRDGFINAEDSANDLVIAFLRGENITSNGEVITTALIKTGADSGLVEQLKTSLVGLLDTSKPFSVKQLNTAIGVYNQIIKQSDDKTIISLNESDEFKKIYQVLKKQRRRIDCPDGSCLGL